MSVGLTFPTGHMPTPGRVAQPPVLGEPLRARACRCGPHETVDAGTDECVRCGHYPKRVIQRTWHDRAQKVARKAA